MTKRSQKAVTPKRKKSVSLRMSIKKNNIAPKSVSYQDYLIDSLQDPQEATGYLNAALEGGDINVFLLALQNVVQAQGGIAMLATKVKKSRTSLYKTLSEKGNPYLKSTNELLFAMGMHFSVVQNGKRRSKAA